MFDAHTHTQPWSIPIAATSILFVTALVYLRGWLRLRSTSRISFSPWRLWAFVSGLFLVWVATSSPLALLDHLSLTIHMVKHLLLMTVAASLLLLSAPALPLVYGLPGRFIQSEILFRSQPAGWLECSLRNPVLCWMAGTLAVIGWHLPVAFQLALRSHWAHTLEDLSFLLAGLLFWSPVIQPATSKTRSLRWYVPLYLFLATVPCDILSAFLAFCNRVVYPIYLSTPQLGNLSPLQDQECAGALMWVWVTFAYLIPAVVITIQILSPASIHTQKVGTWHGIPVQSLSDSGAEVL
jgi:cytochrome c oxidase assembly factor CtaG